MKRQWWKESVVYQIYPQSFLDTDGDGVGDLRGITEKIPYIRELGADVIWLCPVYASPMADQGYDISDYRHVNPMFGTDEDLEELIRTAEAHGIRVLMDLVVNHCSDQHTWFQEALRDPQSPYRDYFLIRETADSSRPNNLRNYFGGPAWTRMGDSNAFYFHCFAPEQPDLNWENPALRQEIMDIMEYWLSKGIAGFRVDAIGNLKKAPEVFREQDFPADGTDGLVDISPYVMLQDGIGDFLGEMRRVFRKWDAFTVSELDVPADKLEEYTGEDGYFSTTFDFTYVDMDVVCQNGMSVQRRVTPRELGDRIQISQLAIQKTSWGAPFLENHDQPRSVNKYIPEGQLGFMSKTALGAVFFFLRGTPFIYQGQEIGMENYPFEDVDDFRDVAAVEPLRSAVNDEERERRLAFFKSRGRDNGRTPMQWEDAPQAGFTDGKPWIAVNPNYRDINVRKQMVEPRSVFRFYREMIRLRKDPAWSEALIYGEYLPVEGLSESAHSGETDEEQKMRENVIAYQRRSKNRAVMVLANLSGKTVPLPGNIQGRVLLDNASFGRTGKGASEGAPKFLQPWQMIVVG